MTKSTTTKKSTSPTKAPKKKAAAKKTAKKSAKLKGTARPVRQGILPGTVPAPTKKIINMAEDLQSIRAERMRLQDEEAEAQSKLSAAMDADKIDKFEFDGFECLNEVSDPKKKIKIRKIKSDAG